MALKTRNYAVTVGQALSIILAQAQDEDCSHVFTFTEPATPLGSGSLVDFTTLAVNKAILTIRDPQGNLIVSRVGTVVGGPTGGTLAFTIMQTDLLDEAIQVCTIDIKWTDTVGPWTEQLLIAQPFEILQSVSQPTDIPTSPPPIQLYPLPVRAHFDGTTAEVAITWPTQPGDVWATAEQAQTDSTDAIFVQVINATVTRSGCTVQANEPFLGDVIVNVRPKTMVTNGN